MRTKDYQTELSLCYSAQYLDIPYQRPSAPEIIELMLSGQVKDAFEFASLGLIAAAAPWPKLTAKGE